MDAGFLYYLADGTQGDCHQLHGNEMAHLFDGPITCCGVHNGVNNTNGMIFGAAHLEEQVRYNAAGQTWQRSSIGERVHIGWWNDRLPQPHHLIRQQLIPGKSIIDGDGAQWLVPQARMFVAGVDVQPGHEPFQLQLPTTSEFNPETKKWESGNIVDRYRRLWDLCCHFETAMFEGFLALEEQSRSFQFTFPDNELYEFATEALRANYRVGPDELSILNVLNDAVCQKIGEIVIDWHGYLDCLKKNAGSMPAS